MSNFKVSQLPASTELVVEDILPVVDVSQMLTKKAEVGDLIDLASTTIESMPNLIVDPENNFTNFSQVVRTQISGGDGITYTAATGEVKLTNKSITINSTVVNLGGSIVIPTGTTTTLTSGGTIPSNLTFSPSSGNVTATLSTNPLFRSLRVVKDNLGDSDQVAFGFIGLFSSSVAHTPLTVEASPAVTVPAAVIRNLGSGNSLVVEDSASETSRFIIDASGKVGIGIDTSVGAKLEVLQIGSSEPAAKIVNVGTGNSLEVLHSADPEEGKFLIDNEGRTGIGMGGGLSARLQISNVTIEPSVKINDTFVIDINGNLAIGSNTVDVDFSKIILGVNGSSMFNGLHANKAILRLTASNTNIGNNNFIYASGSLNVTGTLPDISTVPIGTEYTFRKFTDATMLIRPQTGQLMEFVANNTLPLTGTGNIFVQIKSIEQAPIGKTWIVIQVQSGGSFSIVT